MRRSRGGTRPNRPSCASRKKNATRRLSRSRAQIVDLTTRVYGEKSIELATPLSNLATAQMRLGELVGAETNYRASIAIIEAEEGLASTRLINPLVGLGETYMRGGLYAGRQTPPTAGLCRPITRQDGFYNLEQMKILDGLSESYLALDKLPPGERPAAAPGGHSAAPVGPRQPGGRSGDCRSSAAGTTAPASTPRHATAYSRMRDASSANRKAATIPPWWTRCSARRSRYENEGAAPEQRKHGQARAGLFSTHNRSPIT